jgi:outer membrane protein with beta-barrel domain
MIGKKVTKWLAVCALGSLCLVGTVQAQNAQTRDGFWFSGGLGYGSLGCDNCGSREGGISGNLSLGGTITPRFLLGVGTSGWTKSEQGATLTVGLVDARIRFYPQTRGGFFVTGGVGIGSVTGSVSGFGSNTETGAGMILGMGYDVRVSRNTSITPYWNAYAMKNSNTDANVGQVGLAVTLH